ncbi:MAG: glycosyltransferase family A protein, partial [Anaerolineales bacterium]
MSSLKFSVIIPAYNNAEFLVEAIQSVLDQSYPNFEIVVVNDASPDNTPEVVRQFRDSRIKYIVHGENQGLSAARNTGINASEGDWIALLDGDDLFHTDKLKHHAEFIANNPNVGVTYNPRFELNHSAKTIRDIWRPPLQVSLSDLVQGFPFGPSDMVVKRDWMFRVGLFNVNHTYVGEDLDINCRLALAGCTFLSVDKALNYRRYYSGRVLKNLRSCIDDT